MSEMQDVKVSTNATGERLLASGVVLNSPTFDLASVAVATHGSSEDLARLFEARGAQIKVLILEYFDSLKSGARPDPEAFANFTQVLWRYGLHLTESSSSQAAEAMHLVKPILDAPFMMKQSGAWSFPILYANAALAAQQARLGCEELVKAGIVITTSFAGHQDRKGVEFAVQVAQSLTQAALAARDLDQAQAVASRMDTWTWNPRDARGPAWRGYCRLTLGKIALSEERIDDAVRLFRDADRLVKNSDPKLIRECAAVLHYAEVLAAQKRYSNQLVKLEQWLDDHTLPALADEPATCRERATARIAVNKPALALAELDPVLVRIDEIEQEAPFQAALTLEMAAGLHCEIGDIAPAWPMFRQAAELYARCDMRQAEMRTRLRHLDCSWTLGVPGEDLQQAGLDLLDTVGNYRQPSPELFYAYVSVGYALDMQDAAFPRVHETFQRAFIIARELESADEALMYCHYGYACVLYRRGDFDNAAEHAQRGRDLLDHSDAAKDLDRVARFEGLIAASALERGDSFTYDICLARLNDLAERDDCFVTEGLIRELKQKRAQLDDRQDDFS